MCNFLSAWVGRPIGDAKPKIFCEPTIDSHSILQKLFKVKAEGRGTQINAARVEFTPPVGSKGMRDYLAFDKYTLKVDENERPGWFDADVEAYVKKELTKILKAMVIDDESRPVLVSGAWILSKNAAIEHADNCRLFVWGGTISAVRGGTISAVWGGTISEVWGDYKPTVIWKHATETPPKGWKADTKTGVLIPDTKRSTKGTP